jgi:hypothetical protein
MPPGSIRRRLVTHKNAGGLRRTSNDKRPLVRYYNNEEVKYDYDHAQVKHLNCQPFYATEI